MNALLGAVGFAEPTMLWALLLLPVIWWLLRMTPPRPLRLVFPPIRLLLGLDARSETPATSPWWLTALRVLIAGLIILALAAPVLRPEERALAAPAGPLVVFLDNGWAAAQDWEARTDALRRAAMLAREQGRPAMLVPTAAATPGGVAAPREAAHLIERIGGLAPLPFAPDRMAALERAFAARGDGAAHIVWLSDGIDHGDGTAFAAGLVDLAAGGPVEAYLPDTTLTPLYLGAPRHDGAGFTVPVGRARAGAALPGRVRALAFNGRYLGEAQFVIPAGALDAEARVELPLELANEVARVAIADIRAAAAVRLLDESWKRPRIGLVTGESQDIAQPLLSPLYYVERALAPYAELRREAGRNLADNIAGLIEAGSGAIVMTDIGRLPAETEERLASWVERGGMLVRFAGPRLASGAGALVPVRLRAGDRTLGGTLSWRTPQPLGAFAEDGPFAGLGVPKEVTVERQVLAEPDAGLAERSWSQLADGTPLVTGARRGKGWIVLFHVTANATWSNLPLSGLFVEMLRRLGDMAPASLAEADSAEGAPAETVPDGAGETDTGRTLEPYRTLTGRGELTTPPATALPISPAALAGAAASADHPPGYYGPPASPRALNTLAADAAPKPLSAPPKDMATRAYHAAAPLPLKPWLLIAAVALLLADGILMLLIAGGAPRLGRAGAALLLAPVLLGGAGAARAQDAATEFALKATLQTRLAYVLTGNGEIDETARRGLIGLGRALAQRTALEPGEPMGIDPARDELAFFPLIYWPIDPGATRQDAAMLARIDAYMKQGGTILFDTRDQAVAGSGGGMPDGPGMQALRAMLSRIDIPLLEPVPADHVLTKAFYLLQAFPGRWDGGALWVEAMPDESEAGRPVRRSDGVSSILITSNDLAAAWAVDEGGAPLYPVVPGDERQREMSLRSGINIVMYALTGNYKADQVHVPALLERLGQ